MTRDDKISARWLLASVAIYLAMLGIVFGIIAAESGKPGIIVIADGARDCILGAIVGLCAFRCRLSRAGLISAISGLLLAVLIAVSFSIGHQFTLWTVLRVFASILLIVFGVLAVRRVDYLGLR